jgi:uncharacterized protein YdhG (YjbR/CyaY superfamily)
MTEASTDTDRIEAILAAAPADQREALQALRRTIAAAAPEADEIISYSMPAFRYHGRALVSYSAFKDHCSLFPMTQALIEANPERVAGFATAKGTLHFTPEHPLPRDLVEWIVRERMAQIDARPVPRRRTG